MDQGEGVEGAERKRDPLDFALWKAQKPGEDTAWESPWGRGRPGLAHRVLGDGRELLGLDFEIHGGGSDLIFPHHENEAAQTFAACGVPLTRLWVHNGMVRQAQREDGQVGRQRVHPARRARRLRTRRADHVLLRRPLPPTDRVRRRSAGGGARERSTGFARRRAGSPTAPSPSWSRAAAGAVLRSAGGRLQHADGAGSGVRLGPRGESPRRRLSATPTCARCSMCSDSRTCSCPTTRRRRERRWRCATRASGARAARDYAEADRLREEMRARGWEVSDGPSGPELLPQA